jgi:hypothetical protein
MAFCLVLLGLATSVWADDDNSLGVGAHYWTTLKNIDLQNLDKHGYSWVASYQYWPSWIGVEADVEWFKSGFAGAPKDVYAPQACLLVGKGIYGAVGIGGYYSDSNWANNPFYTLRAGLDMTLLPHLHIDINGNYRFEDWSGLKGSNINSDTITIGAAVRLSF